MKHAKYLPQKGTKGTRKPVLTTEGQGLKPLPMISHEIYTWADGGYIFHLQAFRGYVAHSFTREQGYGTGAGKTAPAASYDRLATQSAGVWKT
jgi:hypothetical protein